MVSVDRFAVIFRILQTKSATLLAGLLVVWACYSLTPVMAAAASLDRVLVVVNDDIITESELNRELIRLRRELKQRNIQTPSERVLTRQTLDRMIADRVQLQLAERAGIRIPEDSISRAVNMVAQQNNMNVSQLRGALENDGLAFEDFRRQILRELTIRRLREREVNSKVIITEDEIRTVVDSGQSPATLDVEYNLSQILLPADENMSAGALQEIREQADNMVAELREGSDFGALAAQWSKSREAEDGGALGWRKSDQLPALFLNAIKEMSAGEVSDALRSPNGFHILKLHERRGGSEQLIEQYRARHILLRPNEFLSEQEVQERLNRFRDRIASGEEFEQIAKVNSEDSASRVKGGDLGWITPGELDPAMERVIRSLQVNEVSQPFRTAFGIHIVQLTDQRSTRISGDLDRESVRQRLYVRKSDELYERWLRELLDQAYIEYRLDEAG